MSSRCCLPDLYRGSRVYMEHHMPCIGELYGPIYLCNRIHFHHALHHGNLWNDQIQCSVPHQIYLIALRAFLIYLSPLYLINLLCLKKNSLLPNLFLRVSGFNNVLWIWIQKEDCHLLQMLAKTTHGEVFCCADENCVREMIG